MLSRERQRGLWGGTGAEADQPKRPYSLCVSLRLCRFYPLETAPTTRCLLFDDRYLSQARLGTRRVQLRDVHGSVKTSAPPQCLQTMSLTFVLDQSLVSGSALNRKPKSIMPQPPPLGRLATYMYPTPGVRIWTRIRSYVLFLLCVVFSVHILLKTVWTSDVSLLRRQGSTQAFVTTAEQLYVALQMTICCWMIRERNAQRSCALSGRGALEAKDSWSVQRHAGDRPEIPAAINATRFILCLYTTYSRSYH